MAGNTNASSRIRPQPAAALSAALADRSDLALFVVERTPMPMVIADARDPETPIVWANQAFLDLSGYTAQEVLGRNCRFLQGPSTAPDAVEEIRRVMASQRPAAVELLNYRKDGSTSGTNCISTL